MYVTKNERKGKKSPRDSTDGTNKLHVEERWIFRTQKRKAPRLGTTKSSKESNCDKDHNFQDQCLTKREPMKTQADGSLGMNLTKKRVRERLQKWRTQAPGLYILSC